MTRKGGSALKSRGRNSHKPPQTLSNAMGMLIKNWMFPGVFGEIKWVQDKMALSLQGMIDSNITGFDNLVPSPIICTTLKASDTTFHIIPLYVMSDVLLTYMSIKDIGNLQITCCGLMELIELTCELTAEMYVSRSIKKTAPLKVGSYVHRTPLTIQKATKACCRNLSIVCTLSLFDPLFSQQKEDVCFDYLARVQGRGSLDPCQFLDENMRASVVDWMAEVSVEFALAPSVLHCAVQLVDMILSALPLSRSRFQLLGCAALLLRSRSLSAQSSGEISPMNEVDVIFMCDSQYSVDEVRGMVSIIERHHANRMIVTGGSGPLPDSDSVDMNIDIYDSLIRNGHEKLSHLDTAPSPTTLSFLAPLCAALHLPLVMCQQLEFNMPACMNNGRGEGGSSPSPSAAEHVLLAIFLSDLSLLDYHMLRFSPFTISNAVMCLTRMTMHHYASGQLLLTPYGVADGKSREVKQLIGYLAMFDSAYNIVWT